MFTSKEKLILNQLLNQSLHTLDRQAHNAKDEGKTTHNKRFQSMADEVLAIIDKLT